MYLINHVKNYTEVCKKALICMRTLWIEIIDKEISLFFVTLYQIFTDFEGFCHHNIVIVIFNNWLFKKGKF
jgi:hypothetical protein